jgi:hypothetical protein
MCGPANLIKIGALISATIILATNPIADRAYAQKRPDVVFSAGGPPRGVPALRIGPGGRPNGSLFRSHGFRGGFDRGRRDFGPNVVVAPNVVGPPALDYAAPPPPYSLRCILHRRVQTPNGPALEPVFVC